MVVLTFATKHFLKYLLKQYCRLTEYLNTLRKCNFKYCDTAKYLEEQWTMFIQQSQAAFHTLSHLVLIKG